MRKNSRIKNGLSRERFSYTISAIRVPPLLSLHIFITTKHHYRHCLHLVILIQKAIETMFSWNVLAAAVSFVLAEF